MGNAVRHQAAAAFGLSVEHVEPPQLVRYKPGERYMLHVDWGKSEDASLWVAGQRVATVLAYINGYPPQISYPGGATHFPQLGHNGLRLAPQAGAALLWPNVGCNGQPLAETEHEAEPPTE